MICIEMGLLMLIKPVKELGNVENEAILDVSRFQ
jgi:hypothetical protein